MPRTVRHLALPLLAALGVAGLAHAAPPKDIVETAVSAGSFKSLVAAVQAADLVATLKGAGPYTVFAPTDEAFAKIPKGDLDALFKDKARLKAVLTNHVLPMKATTEDLAGLKTISSAQGSRLTFESGKAGFKVNGAKVVMANVDASNGIIHAVDTVLLPK
jgi:uncharacterized surface protein with fasciclin (FAS1) repeats